MKKWKEALTDIRASTANAVNSAVRQIDKSLTNEAILPPQQQERVPDPQQFLRWVADALNCYSTTMQQQRGLPVPYAHTYLFVSARLPVESAKKLRWYDNADLAKMSVQHVREKHMLLDTITALKKVNKILKAGGYFCNKQLFLDSAVECRQLGACPSLGASIRAAAVPVCQSWQQPCYWLYHVLQQRAGTVVS
jgi:hypothetical protein